MDTAENSDTEKIRSNWRTVIGGLLVAAGGLLFIDQYMRTGWLSLAVLPGIGLFVYLWGIRARLDILLVLGGVIAGLGLGLVSAAGSPQAGWVWQAGRFLVMSAVGWLLVTGGTRAFGRRTAWWALVPAGVLGGTGISLLAAGLAWPDMVMWLSLGLGAALLSWGLVTRLIGLIIPASLLLGIGPGIYYAWGSGSTDNGLASTGVMLVWFAFGWFLIVVFSRVTSRKSIWWPLIPGGILTVVGCGLYIGGDPGSALGFIGNTGSIALVIFGLYLLLMRKGIHH